MGPGVGKASLLSPEASQAKMRGRPSRERGPGAQKVRETAKNQAEKPAKGPYANVSLNFVPNRILRVKCLKKCV